VGIRRNAGDFAHATRKARDSSSFAIDQDLTAWFNVEPVGTGHAALLL